MRYDSHVQAWTRDRVLVLSMLEELHALECKSCRLEMKREGIRLIRRACGVK